MNQQLSGIIHGKTIELDNDPGLADGQMVVVTVLPKSADPKINPKTGRPWAEGFSKTAGAFADDPNAEKYLEEILRLRKADFGREIPE